MNSQFIQRLCRTKSPQELIDNSIGDAGQSMHKSLSAWDLVAFGIGATVGSGIFALTGTAAAGQLSQTTGWLHSPLINLLMGSELGREGAGPAVVFSFLIAAIACGLTAVCYAELASMIPVSGSAYTFAYASLGEFIAWIIGWDLILEYAVGNIAVAVSWSDYFLHVYHGLTNSGLPLWLTTDNITAQARIGQMSTDHALRSLYSDITLPTLFGHPVSLNLPALFIVVVLTWLCIVGIKESARMNLLAVAIKLIVIIFFIGYGFHLIQPSNWVPFAPTGITGILQASAIVFFSFIGFDAVSSTAEEVKNPQRDLPIGMIGTLIICTILYMAVSLVLTGILPYKSYLGDAAPVATALQSNGSSFAHLIVSVGALAGMTSVLLVCQIGQPRILMAMARDGLLPKAFAKLHPKFKTPVMPTILTGIFVGLPALFIDISQAAELTNIGTLSAFILVCIGVIVLRKTHPQQPRAFLCPLNPILPILGILSCLGLMLSLPAITWLRFLAWLAIGLAIYFLYGMRTQTRQS